MLVFGENGAVSLEDIPSGRFRSQLEALTSAAREKALKKLEALEVPVADVASLHVDSKGMLLYACPGPTPNPGQADPHASHSHATPPITFEADPVSEQPASGAPVPQAAPVPISAPPVRHSKAGAPNVIYLDFNGHVVSGTAWVSGATRNCVPFDNDGDATTFSDAEQQIILDVWQRVSEDYLPFDVDVTTEEPASFANNRVARALITRSTDASGLANPSDSAGGVAYSDVFTDPEYASTYSPAFIYYNNVAGTASNIAAASAHEVGHNMGLSHDGTSFVEYYGTHGTGEISWGPIMGSGYTGNLTQWSKGDYFNANNKENDVVIIANKLSTRTDDISGTLLGACDLSGNSTVATGNGIIEALYDTDVFRFTTTYPQAHLVVSPFRASAAPWGGNLDVVAELLDSSGTLLTRWDPPTMPRIATTQTLAPGSYYLRISANGTGSPLADPPTGYTSYGSLGAYAINLEFQHAFPPVYKPLIGAPATLTVTPGGTPPFTFTWKKNNKTLVGAGNATLVLPSVTPTDAGAYSVQVADGNGTVSEVHTFVIPHYAMSEVRAWGANASGQCQVPAGLTDAAALAAGAAHSMALTSNGSVVAWGNNTYGQSTVPAGLSDVVALSSRYYHCLALKDDRTVVAWGDSWNGITSVPTNLADVVAVAAGRSHSLALKSDGTVVGWGDAASGASVPLGLTGVTAIAAGYAHSLALKTDGTIVAWGDNGQGQCSVPGGLTDVVAIAAGYWHSMALKSDGTVLKWGYWEAGTVPVALSGVTSIAAGARHCLALRGNGTMSVWGSNANGETTLPSDITTAGMAAGGDYFSMVILDTSSPPSLTPYEQWASTAFPAGTATDKTLPLADSDGNGISNLLRFSFGILPGSSAQMPNLPTLAEPANVGAVNYLTISFRRRTAIPQGVTYAVEQSTNLAAAWSTLDATALQVGSPIPNGDGTETVTVRSSLPLTPTSPPIFLRVRTTLE